MAIALPSRCEVLYSIFIDVCFDFPVIHVGLDLNSLTEGRQKVNLFFSHEKLLDTNYQLFSLIQRILDIYIILVVYILYYV